MWVNERDFDNLEEKLKVEFCKKVLDRMIQWIDERFSQETQFLLQCFRILQPEELIIDRNNLHVDNLDHIGSFYQLDVASLQTYSMPCSWKQDETARSSSSLSQMFSES